MSPTLRPAAVVAAAGLMIATLCLNTTSLACPFCSAVSQTLRQEIAVMDAVVIASAVQGDATRDPETGRVKMKVQQVLKGGKLVTVGAEVEAVYYGDVTVGRRFMLTGANPDNLQWSCLPVSAKAEQYVINVVKYADADPLEQLKFYDDYLQDAESMLSRDAYDEFAIAPYEVIRKLGPEMKRDQLVAWISDPEMSTDRKRLYLTMLGICGDEKELPRLETMLRSTKKSTRGSLDALIACYLTLAGEQGLPLIDELFLNNSDTSYSDTYAAILAIRFHGTEGNVIARSALLESLHHVLKRKDLADLVIADLARWQDWSQVDRLVMLFEKSDPENNWIRVPVVNYLRACPLDKAKVAIEKLTKLDPESVKRANSFFSIPIPAREAKSEDGASVKRSSSRKFAQRDVAPQDPASQNPALSTLVAFPGLSGTGKSPLASDPAWWKPHQRTASLGPLRATNSAAISAPQADLLTQVNPWRMVYVLMLALATFMITAFLLLTGGPQPELE